MYECLYDYSLHVHKCLYVHSHIYKYLYVHKSEIKRKFADKKITAEFGTFIILNFLSP